MASYSARFECSVCQGTLSDASFCALECGHCFHTVCVYTWLERSPTCPGCRASAKNKKKIRALNGIDAVADATGQASQVHAQQQHVHRLEQQLKSAEQQIGSLEEKVRGLHYEQASLQKKVAAYKHRCSELETLRAQDADRLTAVTLDLSNLRETHITQVERLRREVVAVRQKAAADVAHFKLQHPSLSLDDMQHLVGPHEQLSEGRRELLTILAQRNKQLQQAEQRTSQLQQQLEQQQHALEAQLTATARLQQAAELEVDKVKDGAMKQVIELEYANDKLQQEYKVQQQQLQELQDVLLALQGGTAPPRRQRDERAPQQQQQQQQQLLAPASGNAPEPGYHRPSTGGGFMQAQAGALAAQQCSSSRQHTQQQQQRQQENQVEAPAPVANSGDGWAADVAAAALGPGSMLQRHMAQVPSFVKPGAPTIAAGVTVRGQLLRHGPDGKGSTTSNAGMAAKRINKDAMRMASKKARGNTPAVAARDIKSFFGNSNQANSSSTAHRTL